MKKLNKQSCLRAEKCSQLKKSHFKPIMGVQGGVGQRRSKPMGGFQRKKENRFPHCSIKILAENRIQILIVSVARCGHRFDNDMKISFFSAWGGLVEMSCIGNISQR